MAGRGTYPVQNIQSYIAIILAFRFNKKYKLIVAVFSIVLSWLKRGYKPRLAQNNGL